MTPNKSSLRFVFVAVATVVLAAGCSKSSKSKGASGGATKAVQSAFVYLPKDASAVFGLNVGSNLGPMKDLVEKQLPPQLAAIKKQCGIDLFAQLKTIVGSMGASMRDRGSQYVVVSGDFDKAKINECVNKSTDKDGKKFSAKEDGKLTVYTREGDKRTAYAWWPKSNTVVLGSNRKGLEGLMSQKNNISDNRRLMGLIKSTDTAGLGWVAGTLPLPISPDPDGTILQMSASSDSLTITARFRYADKGAAATAKDALSKKLAGFNKGMAAMFVGPFIEKIKLSTDGRDAVAKLELDDAMSKRLLDLAKMGMRMRGGGR